jgi:hypothetical protein
MLAYRILAAAQPSCYNRCKGHGNSRVEEPPTRRVTLECLLRVNLSHCALPYEGQLTPPTLNFG